MMEPAVQERPAEAPRRAVSRTRVLAALLTAVFAGTGGDLLLSHGMKQVTEVAPFGISHLPVLAAAAVHTPALIAGIACMAVYFGLYMAALSWVDLSYALPITALGFVIVALFSQVILHEHVSLVRWLGVATIVTGVVSISRS